jgi:hypothetical protein
MRNDESNAPTGISLRRRVRALTVGAAGAAVLTTVGVTATLAYTQIASDSGGSTSTGVEDAGDETGASELSAANGSGKSTYSGGLVAPIQPPTGTYNTGHVGSGGS